MLGENGVEKIPRQKDEPQERAYRDKAEKEQQRDTTRVERTVSITTWTPLSPCLVYELIQQVVEGVGDKVREVMGRRYGLPPSVAKVRNDIRGHVNAGRPAARRQGGRAGRLSDLEKRKLIERTGHLVNRKVKTTILTAKGNELVLLARKRVGEVEKELYQELSTSESDKLKSLIAKIGTRPPR